MYILLNDKEELKGFSDIKDEDYKNIEISNEEHAKIMNLQSQGTLYWDKTTKKIKVIALGQFEYIDENGEVKKDTAAELKYYRDLLLTLKKEKVQLKKDIRDFEEFGEETAELEEQLKEKEKQIAEMENKIKELEG